MTAQPYEYNLHHHAFYMSLTSGSFMCKLKKRAEIILVCVDTRHIIFFPAVQSYGIWIRALLTAGVYPELLMQITII